MTKTKTPAPPKQTPEEIAAEKEAAAVAEANALDAKATEAREKAGPTPGEKLAAKRQALVDDLAALDAEIAEAVEKGRAGGVE